MIQATLDKLREMNLTVMAESYRAQCEDPKMKELAFDERLSLLVDVEYSNKRNARFKKLLQTAGLDNPQASIAGINYECGRRLDREFIHQLATCDYIRDKHNVIITGATGSGKTYLACAFGMEACKQFYTAKYIRLPELLLEMKLAREANKMRSVILKYTRPALLILDEWLLVKCPQESQYDLMELIHHKTKSGSTIFCSQFRVSGWYEQLGGTSSPLADAILDRIVHSSYKIDIVPIDPSKDISMREYYGLRP